MRVHHSVILKMTPPYFLRIYVYFRRFIELPPQTVRFAFTASDSSVCRFEQSLTKSVIFGLRIGEIKYENELNLVHNNCRIKIRGNQ